MPVHQIHKEDERLLRQPVSYRSIKGALSDHARGRSRCFERVRHGWYALPVNLVRNSLLPAR